MAKLSRRITIMTLVMAIFAILLAQLVISTSENPRRMQVGVASGCINPASPLCMATL
ncbi:hypothetical protein G6N76_06335 [Rhizobium daejeonense]|uniref:Uncharacterized protein n=1 Tax=Rhizobium daejeonense TaxID=240521 RepID=A0A6M1RWM0_9HYPH|nr:hypothetical protein [Rhizobium daejeonense]NGO63285.1 hypothetical protein [Rhizobium daejeonense]